MKSYIFIFTIFASCSLIGGQHSLNELSIKHGTDKGPLWHNYTPTYAFYFDRLKDDPIKFLEIGFLVGSSARMWDEYFTHPSTKLHFIDIDNGCYKHMKKLSSRCALHLVDQSNKEKLDEYVQNVGGDFDIIIDDGGHTMIQQITSFQALFPHLKKGGVYIIEDLHTSYWTKWGGGGSTQMPKASDDSGVRFLQNLIDELNYCGARTECADKAKCSDAMQKTFTYYQKEIASIHFYSSVCFIFKN